jgi:hypothetical protein
MVEELKHFQKLAEICLNTSSTMFAIVFSIIFGLWSNVGKLSTGYKIGFLGITITFVVEASMCFLALYGRRKEDLVYVSLLAKVAVLVMFAMIVEMVTMLSSLLFM